MELAVIGFVGQKFILVGIIFAISLVVAMYSTYAERKVAAFSRTALALTAQARLVYCSPWQMAPKCL